MRLFLLFTKILRIILFLLHLFHFNWIDALFYFFWFVYEYAVNTERLTVATLFTSCKARSCYC